MVFDEYVCGGVRRDGGISGGGADQVYKFMGFITVVLQIVGGITSDVKNGILYSGGTLLSRE